MSTASLLSQVQQEILQALTDETKPLSLSELKSSSQTTLSSEVIVNALCILKKKGLVVSLPHADGNSYYLSTTPSKVEPIIETSEPVTVGRVQKVSRRSPRRSHQDEVLRVLKKKKPEVSFTPLKAKFHSRRLEALVGRLKSGALPSDPRVIEWLDTLIDEFGRNDQNPNR